MSSFSHLSDIEIRNKLLEYGYDLPVSLNKAFLLRKLDKIVKETEGKSAAAGRGRLKTESKVDFDPAPAATSQTTTTGTGTRSRGRSSVAPKEATTPIKRSTPATRQSVTAIKSTRAKAGTRSSVASHAPQEQVAVEANRSQSHPVVSAFEPTGNMFAIIVSGRLVQSNFVQSSLEKNKFAIDIPQVDGVNHVVVFLTGSDPFPSGTGGQIYFGWTETNSQEERRWHLLGYITNEKPSVIFKVSDLKKALELYQNHSQRNRQLDSSNSAQIGISIESLQVIFNAQPTFETEL